MVVVGISASLASLSFFYRDHYLHYLGKVWFETVDSERIAIARTFPQRLSEGANFHCVQFQRERISIASKGFEGF